MAQLLCFSLSLSRSLPILCDISLMLANLHTHFITHYTLHLHTSAATTTTTTKKSSHIPNTNLPPDVCWSSAQWRIFSTLVAHHIYGRIFIREFIVRYRMPPINSKQSILYIFFSNNFDWADCINDSIKRYSPYSACVKREEIINGIVCATSESCVSFSSRNDTILVTWNNHLIS